MIYKNTKLTPDEQAEILRLYRLDAKPYWTLKRLGAKYGASLATIHRVIHGTYSQRARPDMLREPIREGIKRLLKLGKTPTQVADSLGCSRQIACAYRRRLRAGRDGGIQ